MWYGIGALHPDWYPVSEVLCCSGRQAGYNLFLFVTSYKMYLEYCDLRGAHNIYIYLLEKNIIDFKHSNIIDQVG